MGAGKVALVRVGKLQRFDGVEIERSGAPLPLSPERQALAEAIAVRDERRIEIDATTRAHATAVEAVNRARSEYEAAQEAVETAKAATVTHLVAVAAGKVSRPPQTIRAARDAMTDAAHALEAAQEAQAALEPALANVGKIDWVQEKVIDAARRVLATAPGVARLVAEVAELQRALVARGSELKWLARNSAIPIGEKGMLGGTTNPTEAEIVATRLDRTPTSWTDRDLLPDPAGAASWQAALDRLMIDASAEVP